jgi:hypothetical protein
VVAGFRSHLAMLEERNLIQDRSRSKLTQMKSAYCISAPNATKFPKSFDMRGQWMKDRIHHVNSTFSGHLENSICRLLYQAPPTLAIPLNAGRYLQKQISTQCAGCVIVPTVPPRNQHARRQSNDYADSVGHWSKPETPNHRNNHVVTITYLP